MGSAASYLVINNSLTETTTVTLPKEAEVYQLSAETLRSQTMLCNGKALVLGEGDALPEITPAAAPAGATTVEAPMPGKILNIKVSEGQAVKFGEVVVIMEAMKMETEIVAPADGTVSKILVKAGDSVDTGAALVALN